MSLPTENADKTTYKNPGPYYDKKVSGFFMRRESGAGYTNIYSGDIVVISGSLVKHFGYRELIVRRIVKAL